MTSPSIAGSGSKKNPVVAVTSTRSPAEQQLQPEALAQGQGADQHRYWAADVDGVELALRDRVDDVAVRLHDVRFVDAFLLHV